MKYGSGREISVPRHPLKLQEFPFRTLVGCFAYLTLSLTGIVLPAHRQVVSQVLLPL